MRTVTRLILWSSIVTITAEGVNRFLHFGSDACVTLSLFALCLMLGAVSEYLMPAIVWALRSAIDNARNSKYMPGYEKLCFFALAPITGVILMLYFGWLAKYVHGPGRQPFWYFDLWGSNVLEIVFVLLCLMSLVLVGAGYLLKDAALVCEQDAR